MFVSNRYFVDSDQASFIVLIRYYNKEYLHVARPLPTSFVTWRLKWLITQKYQDEVVYQEEGAPALMKAVIFHINIGASIDDLN
ncbi:MAG TPA: hypothetical protein VIF86_04005 [Methylobacter sp.]